MAQLCQPTAYYVQKRVLEFKGLSLVELLYGRTVRLPMKIWTKDDASEVRKSYHYLFELMERLKETLRLKLDSSVIMAARLRKEA